MKKKFIFPALVIVFLQTVSLIYTAGGGDVRTQVCRYPASTVDHLALKQDNTAFGFLSSQLGSRVVSCIVFPCAAFVDAMTHFSAATSHASLSVLNRDENRLIEWDKASECGRSARHRIGACVLAIPSGLIEPDTVTHYFVPRRQLIGVHPYGGLYHSLAPLLKPESIEEVQDIVKKAGKEKRCISISGARYSQGRQILPPDDSGVILDLSRMNSVSVDPIAKVARVAAGATWDVIQQEVNKHGFAIKTMQASNVFSVGGSLGINCHGWDIRSGAIGNTARQLKVVDGNGKLHSVSRDDEYFKHVVGGMGAFGVIVEAELELTDNTTLERSGEVISLEEYVDYFRRLQKDDSVHLHLAALSLDPQNLFEEVVAENYRAYPDQMDTQSPIETRSLFAQSAEKVALQYARKRNYVRKLGWKAKKIDLLLNKVQTRNNHMTFPIDAMMSEAKSQADWLQEYFVSPDELPQFVRMLKEILERNKVPIYNASIRYIPKDGASKLGYAKDGERFAIVICFSQSLAKKSIAKTTSWIKEVNEYLLQHGGTYYLSYMEFASKAQFDACHEEWSQIDKIKQRYDPNGVFQSAFLKKYVFKEKKDSTFRRVFTNRDLRAGMDSFLQSIFTQVDTHAFNKLMDELLEKCDSDEEIYNVLKKRISEAQFGALKTPFAKLSSLKAQVHAIAEQVDTLLPMDAEINGYVEVETPGRFVNALKRVRPFSGKVHAVNHERSIADYLEASFPLPFDEYHDLKGYSPLPQEIESDSVGLVSCFKGVHHIKGDDSLNAFIDSIHRVLKPGGYFLLREHDITNENVKAFAAMAHTVFNAETGEPLEVELSEHRNFQSVQYWKELLKEHGFEFVKGNLIRAGDPTKNTLLLFRKIKSDSDKQLDMIHSQIKNKDEYHGDCVGYTFQAAEWQNVLSAKQYAEVVKRVPFYEFQFMKHVGKFWEVFGKAYSYEAKKHGHLAVLGSYYTYMSLFVGVNMTVEYSVKSAISTAVQFVFGSSPDDRPLPIQMLIKDKERIAQKIDPRVKVIQRFNSTDVYLIETRRFYELTEFVEKACDSSIELVEFAGSKSTQLRVHFPKGKKSSLDKIDGAKLLFTWSNFEDKATDLAQVQVEVTRLGEVLKELKKRSIKLEFVHDL